jgi:hypothetical protein
MTTIHAVRRKSVLLAAGSILLAALGLEAYALGYPIGMALLAVSTVQAAACCAMFASHLVRAVALANFVLLVFHAGVISRFLVEADPPLVFQLGDFCCAVFASASLVFTPVETLALIVREAYQQRMRER